MGTCAGSQGEDAKGAPRVRGALCSGRCRPQPLPFPTQPKTSEVGMKHRTGDCPQALTAARQAHLCLFFQNKTKNHHSKYLRRVLKLKAFHRICSQNIRRLVVRNESSASSLHCCSPRAAIQAVG